MINYVLAAFIAPIAIDNKISNTIMKSSIIKIEDEKIKDIIKYDRLEYNDEYITFFLSDRKIKVNKNNIFPSIIKNFNEKEFFDYMKTSLATPGFVNAHTHSLESLFQGLYTFNWRSNGPFKHKNMLDWLNNSKMGATACGVMLLAGEKYLYNAIGENVWTIGARKTMLDQISSGITYYRDHLWNIKSIIPSIIQHNIEYDLNVTVSVDCLPTKEGRLMNVTNIIDQYKNLPKISLELGGTDIAVKDILHEIADLSDKYNLPVHLHLAETKMQRKILNNAPLNILKNKGLLNSKLSIAHAVYLEEEEYELLSKYGVSVVVNDRANGFLGSKKASLSDMLKYNLKCGIGTDGAATIGLNFLSLLNFSVCSERMYHEDPTVMDAYTILFLATYGGASTLGIENEIGSIEIEKYADINIFKLSRPIYDPIDNLVFLANKENLRSVIIRGKECFSNNKVKKIDEEDLEVKLEVVEKFLKDRCC
jgi:5-methylthioadenosine/S-adenosylhomocysteine deaminase